MESTVYYGKNGVECEEANFLAKHTTYERGESYWIWFWRGAAYDVYNDAGFRPNSPMAKLTRISKEKFELYVKYLKTKNRIFYTQAIRL